MPNKAKIKQLTRNTIATPVDKAAVRGRKAGAKDGRVMAKVKDDRAMSLTRVKSNNPMGKAYNKSYKTAFGKSMRKASR